MTTNSDINTDINSAIVNCISYERNIILWKNSMFFSFALRLIGIEQYFGLPVLTNNDHFQILSIRYFLHVYAKVVTTRWYLNLISTQAWNIREIIYMSNSLHKTHTHIWMYAISTKILITEASGKQYTKWRKETHQF